MKRVTRRRILRGLGICTLGVAVLASTAAAAANRHPSSVVSPWTLIDTLTDLSSKNVRSEESNLADIIVDALRAAEKADIAFMAASSFEDVNIRKGATSSDDILKAVTFHDDPVVVVKLTGEQVRRALEYACSLSPQRNSCFLQVSGTTVTVDPKAPKNQRIESVRIGGRDLDPGRTYSVAMPAPLADGALGYHTIWQKTSIDKSRLNAKSVQDAINSYLAGKRTLGEPTESRIIFKK